MMRSQFNLSVYFIADSSVCGGRGFLDVVEFAVKRGVTCVQLRNKIDPIEVVEQEALAVQEILADSNIPFIINDYVELAAKIDADGAHIGQEDIAQGMSSEKARSILGEDKILGITAFEREHFAAIDPDVVDYVGIGPFYPSKTKPDKKVLGVENFKELAKISSVPIVAIGGITPKNAGETIRAGADGVAMMRAISEADNPEAVARAFTSAISIARLDL